MARIEDRIVKKRELDEIALRGGATKPKAQAAAVKKARREGFADQDDLNTPAPEVIESGSLEEEFEPDLDVVLGTTAPADDADDDEPT